MDKSEKLFNTLPDTFSRMDAKKQLSDLNRSRSWLNVQLEEWIFSGRIERAERGTYRKL